MTFQFKTQPYIKQREALDRSATARAFALHMEQGTGKTKVIIDNAAMLYHDDKIDALLVVAPNGVHKGWVKEQLPVHLHENTPTIAVCWNRAKPKDQERLYALGRALRILTINYEALTTKAGQTAVKRFLTAFRVLWANDESHRYKNPKAQATKFITDHRHLAAYRRNLTGTPAAESPLNLWTQFNFLDPMILRFPSLTSFRAHFAVLEPPTSPLVRSILDKLIAKYGRARAAKMSPQIISRDREGRPRYRNIEQLTDLIAPHSYRCTRDECLDLPPKIYEKRFVEMNAEQKRMYVSLRDNFMAEVNGGLITAPLAITRMMRLQQVTGGFVPDESGTTQPLGISNPKMEALLEIAEDYPGKIIIWSRFVAELELISTHLEEIGGVARYWGEISSAQREENKRRFIEDPECRFWVSQPRAGGTGIDGLQRVASTVVYFSNEFSLTSRLQSEDRAHRDGQKHSVVYIDLEAEDTIDAAIINALRAKKEVADLITGDDWKTWL